MENQIMKFQEMEIISVPLERILGEGLVRA